MEKVIVIKLLTKKNTMYRLIGIFNRNLSGFSGRARKHPNRNYLAIFGEK